MYFFTHSSCPKRGVLATFRAVSTAVTQGIRITVKSRFLPEQSSGGRWAFAYTVRIENVGSITAQLRSRHWIITDGNGKREEVKGDGVVGNQPILRPGEFKESGFGRDQGKDALEKYTQTKSVWVGL